MRSDWEIETIKVKKSRSNTPSIATSLMHSFESNCWKIIRLKSTHNELYYHSYRYDWFVTSHKEFNGKGHGVILTTDEVSRQKDLEIFSVVRKSDNRVFNIGDTIRIKGVSSEVQREILGFYNIKGLMRVAVCQVGISSSVFTLNLDDLD